MQGFLKDNRKNIILFFRILDPLFLTFNFWYFSVYKLNDQILANSNLGNFLIVFLLSFLLLPKGQIYQNNRANSLIKLFKNITSNWMLIIICIYIFLTFSSINDIFLKKFFLAWATFGWIHLVFIHIIGRKFLRFYRIRGGNSINLVYWGSQEDVSSLNQQIKDNPYLGYRLKAWFNPFNENTNSANGFNFESSGNSLAALKNWVLKNSTDLIIFSDYKNNQYEFKELITYLADLGIPISYLPNWFSIGMSLEMFNIGNKAILNLWQPSMSKIDSLVKRIFDIIFSLIVIIILSPLFLIVSILIKKDSPGPIIFKQTRYGIDSRKFGIYKFRTMFVTESGDKIGLKQASKFDKRITKIGKFLRKWSIDELPQFINVLLGEMSIVGPRPHAVEHNEYYRLLIPGYMQRHLIKPGITGLAQIKGLRGQTLTIQEMEKRIEEDLIYLREWNFILDIKIIIKTLLNIKSPNAF